MRRTVPYTAVCVLLIWLANIGGVVPQWLLSQLVYFLIANDEQYFCILFFPSAMIRRTYTLIMFFVFYLLPLLTISFSYTAMTRYLWSCTRGSLKKRQKEYQEKLQKQQKTMTSAKTARRRCRVMRTVLIIVVVFSICWLPIHAVNIINAFLTHESTSLQLSFVIKIGSHALAYVSSALNPIIYAFVSQTFRQSAKNAFACRCGSLTLAYDTLILRSRCQKSTPDAIITL